MNVSAAVGMPAGHGANSKGTPRMARTMGAGMALLDPLQDREWNGLLGTRKDASVFHGSGWARVLNETYGHSPIYVGRIADGRLAELLPVMEIASHWKGKRGIALPFTDFAAPLTAGSDGSDLFQSAVEIGEERGWRFLECRGGNFQTLGATPSVSFYGHVIELGADPEAQFKLLESSVRRAIRKATNAGLIVEFNSSFEGIREFYSLHCITRRKHGLPPQPFRFFENIQRNLLESGHGFTAVARFNSLPVAAAVFLHAGTQALYKFGASDVFFQQVRPNNLLMWEAMKRYSALGFKTLHLGRTSLTNEGLRRFKLGFGSREETIAYYKYSLTRHEFVTDVDRAEGWFNTFFRCLPMPLLRLAGQILYPHLS